MGMDLKPIRPSKKAPRDENGHPKWGRYNISGWSYIWDQLNRWGVDTSEFSGYNDGDKISAKTCRAVADAIEKHLPEMSERDRRWLEPHVILWRTCGGYRQY